MRKHNPVTSISASYLVTLVALNGTSTAKTINASFDGPSLDRWMYAFNSSPGSRTTASTFGAFVEDPPVFDNRDGQLLLAFDTSSQIASSLGDSSYTIVSARMTIQNENDMVFVYDSTPDSYTAYLAPDDPEYVADTDSGQALELFGTGYRGGFSTFSFAENGPYGFGDPTGLSVRNAYALGFDASGNAVDVSNSVREHWSPSPWAVGQIATVNVGDLVPANSQITFDIDVGDKNIQDYLKAALNVGKLDLCLTSFTLVEPMGGAFPSFYMKENPLVIDGIVHAAQLALVVEVDDSTPCPADITDNGKINAPDGVVNIFDLLLLLQNWNSNGPGAAIANPTDNVDVFDLLAMLQAWGPCE